jgi:hypothetical protein
MNQEQELTKEEFQKIIQDKFFKWTSNTNKTIDYWLLSLHDWTQQEYNKLQIKNDYYIIYSDGKHTAKDGFLTYQDAKAYMDKELQVGGVFEGMTPNELEIHKK